MVKVKIAFLIIMVVLACVIFFTPLFFRERNSKEENAKRIRVMVRIRMGCFLGILVLLLLCVIL